jgi:hypothetical protein
MTLSFKASSQNSNQGNGVSSLTCAFGAAVAIGDLLVAHIGWNDVGSYTEISSVTSNSGTLTWTRATGNACVAGNNLTECIYYAVAIAADTPTVSVSWGAVNQPFIDIRVQAFTGFTGTPTFDEAAGATGSSTTPATGNSGTTDVNDEVVVFGGMTGQTYASGVATGYTQHANTSYNDTWGYKIVAATGTQSATAALELTHDWAITLATFKDVTGAATLDQEGFRFRNDDGDENAATWKEAQDTNLTAPLDTNLRVRFIVDGTGDPTATQYQLEAKLSTESDYWKVS